MGTVFGAVVAVTDLSPRLRRLVFDVPKLDELGLPDQGDDAVGIYLPDVPHAAPRAMEYRDGVWAYHDPETMPVGRNYTVRHRGPGPRQITVDFVLHDRGPATTFARDVRIGDQVVLAHARSWYRPGPGTDWRLLVADLAGLPALARIVEELAPGTQATAIVEVPHPGDLDCLPARDDVTVIPVVGSGNGRSRSTLPDRVRAFEHPSGTGYCWFAGECAATREVRKHLRAEHGFTAAQFDIVGYWRVDSETWDRRFAEVGEDLVAVYTQALADGKGDKIASEEFDLALERAGL
jgi:NADPH-dependent ferric siderophore reductase